MVVRPAILGKGFTAHLISIDGSILICIKKTSFLLCFVIKVLSDLSLKTFNVSSTSNIVVLRGAQTNGVQPHGQSWWVLVMMLSTKIGKNRIERGI